MKKYHVKPGHKVHWDKVDPDDKGSFKHKEDALEEMDESIRKMDDLQERLYAEGQRSLLIVLQAIDTGGKDGTVSHVMKGINPQGCRVTSFKAPTPEELSHDFLWRIHRQVPAKGFIGIFNRSHYEDVLVVRVHDLISDQVAEKRFKEINEFEKNLVENGTTVLKFYLVISKEEQRQRLQARVDQPDKRWKFNLDDLTERRYWDRYSEVYAEALSATSTAHAPWYLIPANHKWFRDYLVAKIIAATLEEMNPKYPSSVGGIDFDKVRIPA